MAISKKTIIIESLLLFFLLIFSGGSVGSIWSSNINLIDEGQFGSWAFQMLHGKHLYKDIYSTYGPLYTYPLYFLFRMFSPDPFVIRMYLLGTTFLGSLSLLLYSYRLSLKGVYRVCLIFCLAVLPIMTFRQGAGIISILFFVEAVNKKKKMLMFISGCLTMLSFLISPEIAIFVFISQLFLVCIISIMSKTFDYVMPLLLIFFAGICIVIVPFVLLSQSSGWFESYVTVTLDVFRSFSGSRVPNGMNFPSITDIIFSSHSFLGFIRALFSKEVLLYWILIGYVGISLSIIYIFLMKKERSNTNYLLTLFIFGFLLYSTVVTRPGIGHMFFILSPLLLLLLVLMQHMSRHVRSKVTEEKLVSLALLFICSLFFIRLFLLYRIEIWRVFSDVSTYAKRESLPGFSEMTRLNASQRDHILLQIHLIDTYTKTNDRIFYLSDSPMLYLLSGHLNATSYDLSYIANSKQKRFQILTELKENPPEIIIYDNSSWQVDGISNKERLPEVYAYIKKAYSLVDSKSGIDIYKRVK